MRALRGVIVALCLAGLGDSIYLTTVHYEPGALYCSRSGAIDCARVLHSSYATVAGLPVSLFGVAWFAVMAVLTIVRPFDRLMLAWLALGILTVAWLVFVELERLRTICLWCTAAHVLVLVIFVLAVLGPSFAPSAGEEEAPAAVR